MAQINKMTTGYVIQVFDTELNAFISQEFVASEEAEYEYAEDGESTDNSHTEFAPYLPLDMVQPDVLLFNTKKKMP